MATWFGDGLPSLSNLKGQITNFTKEVLSEGIVEEIGMWFLNKILEKWKDFLGCLG